MTATGYVARADLEAQLAQVAGSADPVEGLFGPHTAVWKVARESVVVLAGGRAALMQVAHPYVAHGVTQHSDVFRDVRTRFRRTLGYMYAMVFDTPDNAFALSRKLHTIHSRIHGPIGEDVGRFRRGDRYRANEVDALFWVAATLWDTTVHMYERAVGPLSLADKDAYYSGTRTVCRLFGIPLGAMPDDWAAFTRYVDEMVASPTIEVGDAARRIARAIFVAPRAAARPGYRLIELVTAGLLPPELRAGYRLRFGPRERAVFAASMSALRLGLPLLPPQVRYCPAYISARHRLDGRSARDPLSAGFRWAVLSMLKERGRGRRSARR